MEAGLRVVLEFNPAAAKFAVEGDNFVLTLEDGAHIVFEGLVSAAQGAAAPTIQVAGIDIGADVLIDQARALAGADEPIETAAGEDGEDEGVDGGGGNDIIHGGHDSSGDILIGGDGDDIIFGGSGDDDLRGGTGNDTFLMSAGFGRDDVDGGTGTDIISLDSVLTSADLSDPDDLSAWLSVDQGYTHDAANNTITFGASASGTIDLGGGNEITFLNIEQIVYADVI